MNFSNSAYRPMTERWQAPEYGGSECERLAKAKRLDDQLGQIAAEHKSVSFACSFSIEDIILVERIASLGLGITIFAIDTGRLPGETLEFADHIEDHYDVSIQRIAPDSESLQKLAGLQHDDDIYLSESFRKKCCEVRKLESPRDLRRLQDLREWSHEAIKQVFTRDSGACSADGARASERLFIAVGGDFVDCAKDRMRTGNIA